MEKIDIIALIFVIVGALNWGLYGIFGFDLVNYLFVQLININFFATLVYLLIGIAGLWMAYYVVKDYQK